MSVCLSVCLSVCVCVCVSVCGHHNSKNNWASSSKFGMWSYMIKISVGIAYEQNRPTGVTSALRGQFGFWAKSALKRHCTNIFFRQKLLQITICNFFLQRLFRSPKGCGLCPDGMIRFFGKKCLKNALYKFFFQTEVVKNQNLQLLYYVIFFDILHHYGVIAASQIRSVSRKYCAVVRNRFYILL